MIDLLARAEALGVHVEYRPAAPRMPPAYYHHRRRIIVLRDDLGPVRARCTLAHELGHAEAGDIHTGIPWLDARAERRADRYAARLLISRQDYAEAEELHGPHPGAIAGHLRVTRRLLGVWLEMNGQHDGPARCLVEKKEIAA